MSIREFYHRYSLWIAVAIIVGAVVYTTWDAHHLAAQNAKDSIQRSIDTCRRSNPSRAYLQLRANEVKSDTAKKATYAFAILDCKDTVANNGRPVPLKPVLQKQYLSDYQHGYIDLTRGQSIVGKIPFNKYFGPNAPLHP